MSYLVEPFPRFIDAGAIRTIFEIGSRDGRDAVALDEHYRPERVFVFEPNPPALELCRQALAGRERITLVEAAVCEHNGTVPFWTVVSSH